MKKYLSVIVTRKDGTTFRNPLKLSEVHLISKIAQENLSIEVRLIECATTGQYKAIFG